jgi:hypothetical protein
MFTSIRSAWKNYRADKRGTLTAFVMINFVMMVLAAGIAVDIVRYEQQRACFQSILDSGVLSASSLRNATDPTVVVQSSLDKSDCNLDYSYNPPQVTDDTYNSNNREVEASIEAKFDTFFLSFVGFDHFDMSITSSAKEENPHTEVSLVLDTSGSMAGTRIDSLKTAADAFVETLLATNADSGEERVSISIVPYAAKTNPGPEIANIIWPSALPYSSCFHFEDEAYESTEWRLTDDFGTPIVSRDPEFSIWYPTDVNDLVEEEQVGLRTVTCKRGISNYILPISSDLPAMKLMIAGLGAEGNTGIDDAVKWGVTMLDPSFQPVIQALNELEDINGDQDVDNSQFVIDEFASRPSAYTGDASVKVNNKVLVIMTDGQNTTDYYYENRSEDLAQAWANSDSSSVVYTNPNDTTEWHQMTYPEMWSTISAVHYLKGHDLDLTYQQLYTFSDYTSTGTKNPRLYDICDAFNIRSDDTPKGSILRTYTIAYEAPLAGQEVMEYCASDTGFYKPATSANIEAIFQSIAGSIERLRMTN